VSDDMILRFSHPRRDVWAGNHRAGSGERLRFLFAPVYRTRGRNHGHAARAAPHIYPDSAIHDWTLEYDPLAAGGKGQITLDKRSVSQNLANGHKTAGARLNRFGLITTWVDGNSQTIYFDDLTYTCKQE